MAQGTADVYKMLRRLADYLPLTYTLGGTLAAQDYVGDTSADAGVPLPAGTLDEIYVTLGSGDDGNTTVVLENETTGTTHTTTLDADTFTTETGIGLYFSEGDELSISVGAVTTPGSDANVQLRHKVDRAPMN